MSDCRLSSQANKKTCRIVANMSNILVATNLPISSLGGKKQGGPAFRKFIDMIPSAFNHSYIFTSHPAELQLSDQIQEVSLLKVSFGKTLKLLHESSGFGRVCAYFLRQLVFFIGCIRFKHIKTINYFYAYEIEYVPALKVLSIIYQKPLICRFQGTVLPMTFSMKIFTKLCYWPHLISLSIPSDLCVMTNDGTNGDKVIQALSSKINNNQRILFLRNGFSSYPHDLASYVERLKLIRSKSAYMHLASSSTSCTIKFIIVSRLVNWKRVDLSLKIFEKIASLHKNIELDIIGTGPCQQHLLHLVRNNLNLNSSVTFRGALPHSQVLHYLSKAHFLISNYKLSNLGNPLFEAMSYGCIPVTVNNGTTGQVCIDSYNSIISDEKNILSNADKVSTLILKPRHFESISFNAFRSFYENETSWEKRLSNEFTEILSL